MSDERQSWSETSWDSPHNFMNDSTGVAGHQVYFTTEKEIMSCKGLAADRRMLLSKLSYSVKNKSRIVFVITD